MVTMKDVAGEVGLSVTTVSRALNNHDDVAERTRERIQAIAHRLDYHPDAMARSLQNRRSNAIGLVIPPFLHRAYDAFWLEFIGGTAASCGHSGADLLVSAVDSVEQMNHGFKRLVRGRRVDGLLLCDTRRNDPRIRYLQNHQLPFVSFGRTTGQQDYPYIDVDGAAGVMQAMEQLISLGHRRIAYMGVDPDFSFSHFRLSGYREALARAGIPCDPDLVHEGLSEVAATVVTAKLLDLRDRPTAVFTSADFLALAVLRTARFAGLAVPRDLSVAVFDDNLLVQHADPPLTAVNQPNRRLGEEAASLLLARIANPSFPLVQRLVVPSVIPRLSTAPPGALKLVAVGQ